MRDLSGPWPQTPEELVRLQAVLGSSASAPEPWRPGGRAPVVAGCFVCFARGRVGPGASGDPGWAAAVLMTEGRAGSVVVTTGFAPAAYEPGLLALREGPLLEAAVRALSEQPEILILNATGRDHPRRAGLAVHLGARLSLPTVGVTLRPLLAAGPQPPDVQGAAAPLRIGDETVGYWMRTKRGAHPLAVHAGWRTDPDTAIAVVGTLVRRWRTPEPLRLARRAAREARDRSTAV